MSSGKSNENDPTVKSDNHTSKAAWKYDLSGFNAVASGTEGSKVHDSSPDYSVEKGKASGNTGVPFGDGDSDGDGGGGGGGISFTRGKPHKSNLTPRPANHSIVAWKYDLSGSNNPIGRTILPRPQDPFQDRREKAKPYNNNNNTVVPFGDEDVGEISFTSGRHGNDEDIEEDSIDIDLTSSHIAAAKEIELRREIHSLKEKFKMQDARFDELQEELRKSTSDFDHTKNALEEKARMQEAKVDELQKELEKSISALHHTTDDLHITQDDLQNTRNALQDTTADLQNTKNDVQIEMQELRAHISRGSMLPSSQRSQEEWNNNEGPREEMIAMNGESFVSVHNDSQQGGWSIGEGRLSILPFRPNLTDGSHLASDTYTLMMISDVWSQSWALGVIAFMFQMTLGTMIAFDVINSSSDSSIFDVPVMITNAVRAGQFFTILLCIATQSDVFTSVQAVMLLGKESSWDKFIGKEGDKRTILWYVRIALPNLLKFVQGILVIFVSLVIIVRSDDIIDLLKDFMALMVLSEADNIMFGLAELGYLGQKLQMETVKAKERIVVSDPTNQSTRRIFFVKTSILLGLCLPMIGVWIMILVNQLNGNYFYDKYPKCGGTYELVLEHFGDGKCYGGVLNKLECGFEGGDCINFNLAYPLCKGADLTDLERVGDGYCDKMFLSAECEYDGGDCCPPEIAKDPKFGDGQCNGGIFSTSECAYDNGDCNAFRPSQEYERCPLEELAFIYGSDKVILGDNMCDGEIYMSEECGFEIGDCSLGQIGQDIIFHGVAPEGRNYFDLDMSTDGTTIALGMPNSDENEIVAGYSAKGIVKIYVYNGRLKVWAKQGRILVGDVFSDGFGYSVSLSATGKRVAIGMRLAGIGGQVKVFDFDDSIDDWILVGQPLNGRKVHLTPDGRRLAVQSDLDRSNVPNQGLIQVYEMDETINAWVQVGNDIFGKRQNYLLGADAMELNSMDGSRLSVSGNWANRTDASMQVYEYNQTSSEWIQLGNEILSPNSKSSVISSDGNRIAISSKNSTGTGSGFVTVYDYNTTSQNWAQVGDRIFALTTEDNSNLFGQSIVMSPDGYLIAVSSANSKCFGAQEYCTTGTVHLYSYNGTTFLPTPSKITHSNTMENVIQEREKIRTNSVFGVKLAMSDDGSTLAIGGNNIEEKNGFVKVIDIDESFYLKCAVIKPHWISDEFCDDYAPYNTKECNWDGGDCSIPQPVDGYPECIVSLPGNLNDTYCQPPYNNAECGWDMGDCLPDGTP